MSEYLRDLGKLPDPPRLVVSVTELGQALFEMIRNGEHPSTQTLSTFLRDWSWSIPEDIRAYIAGRLDGSVRLPKGRPKLDTLARRMRGDEWEQFRLAVRVRRWERAFRHPRCAREYRRRTGRVPPPVDAYRAALDRVSEETGIPADTLDRYVHPRPPK